MHPAHRQDDLTARRRAALLVASVAAVVVLAGGGCRLRTDVAVDVGRDGGGTVTVSAGLDDAGVRRLPDLDDDGERGPGDLRRLARTGDLEDAGWTITGPVADDGFTWVRATKPFGTPEEAAVVLAEVARDGGPFRDFRLVRRRSFLRTRFTFEGTVDLGGGLEAFGDDDLAARLGGDPLGEDIAAIERRLGAAVDRLVQVRVAVRLPGDVDSNAPTQAANGAVWRPRLGGEAVELRATSEVRHTASLAWAAVGGVSAVAVATVLTTRLARRLRR